VGKILKKESISTGVTKATRKLCYGWKEGHPTGEIKPRAPRGKIQSRGGPVRARLVGRSLEQQPSITPAELAGGRDTAVHKEFEKGRRARGAECKVHLNHASPRATFSQTTPTEKGLLSKK